MCVQDALHVKYVIEGVGTEDDDVVEVGGDAVGPFIA